MGQSKPRFAAYLAAVLLRLQGSSIAHLDDAFPVRSYASTNGAALPFSAGDTIGVIYSATNFPAGGIAPAYSRVLVIYDSATEAAPP